MRPIASLVWFGILLLAVAGVLLGLKGNYLINGTRAQGTVIDLEQSRSRRGGKVYYPVVEYVGAGQTRRFKSSLGMSPSPYSRGDMVPVIYLRDDPKSGVISDALNMYLLPILAAAAGGACMVGALIAAYCSMRTAPPDSLALTPELPARAA